MTRLEPLKTEECSEELQANFRIWIERMGYVPNTLLTMARKPKMVQAMAMLSGKSGDSLLDSNK